MTEMKRLLLLALLAITLVNAMAQPVQMRVGLEPSAVGPMGLVNLTVSLSGSLPYNSSLKLDVYVLRNGTILTHRARSLTSLESQHLEFPAPEEPGIYEVSVILSYGNESMSRNLSLSVIPTFRDVTKLATGLADLDEKLNKLSLVKLNETEMNELLSKRAEMAQIFGDLVSLLVEGREPVKAAQLYDNISYSMRIIERRVENLWTLELVTWSVSGSIDSSLELPASVGLEFWYRLIMAFSWVLLILIALFPLYTTGYVTLTHYLVSEMEEGRRAEVIQEANQRVLRILGRAFSQIKIISDPKSVIMTSLASALAAVGLMANNVYAIIGSMLLSPLMEAFVAAAIGLALIDVKSEEISGLDLFYRGLKEGLVGVFLIVGLSWLTAFIAASYVPLQLTSELSARGSPNLVDLAIALAAGFAGAVAMMHDSGESALVGSAIAIALVPPAAAVGVSLAMLNPPLFLGSSTLVAVNIVALIAAGYISAKLYSIYPVMERVFHDFLKSLRKISEGGARTGAEVLFESLGSFVIATVRFLSLWFNVSVGLLGTRSLGGALKAVGKRVAFILIPLVLSWLFGVIISTRISTIFSSIHDIFLKLIGFIGALLPRELIIPNLAFFLSLLVSVALLKLTVTEAVRAREQGDPRSKFRVSVYAFLLWLVSGYVLGINRFSHVGAGYTILLIAFVVIYSSKSLWAMRKRIVLYAFVIFTFLTLMIHSAAAFESVRAAHTISSGNVVKVVRGIIASYAGVLPENVNVSLEPKGAKWVLKAIIYVSESRFKRGLVMTPEVVQAAEETVKHALGTDVKLVVEYALVP